MGTLLECSAVSFEESRDHLWLVTGDLLHILVGSGHVAFLMVEHNAVEMLSKEWDRRIICNVFDPLFAGDLLIADFLAEGLAGNCCYLGQRQFDGAEKLIRLPLVAGRVCQKRGDNCALVYRT